MKGVTRDRTISVPLVAPSMILIAVFVYGFIGFTGFSSLTKWDSFEPDFTFVGLRNYQRLFSTIPTDRFLCDLRNTVTFTVLFLIACIVDRLRSWPCCWTGTSRERESSAISSSSPWRSPISSQAWSGGGSSAPATRSQG